MPHLLRASEPPAQCTERERVTHAAPDALSKIDTSCFPEGQSEREYRECITPEQTFMVATLVCGKKPITARGGSDTHTPPSPFFAAHASENGSIAELRSLRN